MAVILRYFSEFGSFRRALRTNGWRMKIYLNFLQQKCSPKLLVMAAICNRGAIIFLPCSFFLLSSSLWSPYVIGQTIIFLPCDFYLSFFFLFFPPLISAVGDWISTILLHMAWPYCEFRMHVWNLLHAARCKYRTQKSRQKSPSGHHRTTLSGYIFATTTRIDNRKKTC